MGQREEKKAMTKKIIQQSALHLFYKQGYESTTIDQIAEVSGVSRRTFFRYFPTKEDVVLYDDMDRYIIETFKAQPSNLEPIEALRVAMQQTFATLSEAELLTERERSKLISTVPELQVQSLNKITQLMHELTNALAKRLDCAASDFKLRMFVGAIMGTLLATAFYSAENNDHNYWESVDKSLAHLQTRLQM